MMVLKNTCHCSDLKGMGRLFKTGTSQKTCHKKKYSSFREIKHRI
jgi:hypothetical protein